MDPTRRRLFPRLSRPAVSRRSGSRAGPPPAARLSLARDLAEMTSARRPRSSIAPAPMVVLGITSSLQREMLPQC